MSGLHGSSLCMEHDEASAMYANIKLVVFVFCFCAAASTLSDRGGPGCQSGFVQEPCAEMQ